MVNSFGEGIDCFQALAEPGAVPIGFEFGAVSLRPRRDQA
jgi:hypothetical protein